MIRINFASEGLVTLNTSKENFTFYSKLITNMCIFNGIPSTDNANQQKINITSNI